MRKWMHKRKKIIEKLLQLSIEHLNMTIEGNWEAWERVADQKEDLYKKLQQLKGTPVDRDEEEMLMSINAVEEKARQQLVKERDETKQELMRIDRFKCGMQGYRHLGRKSSGKHFCIKG
jgi:hypothetical protein